MNRLTETSREVLRDCCCANGAIVAANSDRTDYPHQVQSYRYVWPRDAAFICASLDHLDCVDEQLGFFRWLARAEDLKEKGLLFQNYYTNGRKRWLAFQPDQNGSVLWALTEFMERHPEHRKVLTSLVTLLADGICSIWDTDHFTLITQDLWEESYTYPELGTTFTYSLAACCHGLRCADRMQATKRWTEVALQMKKKIDVSYVDGRFLRRAGLVNDLRPDISLLGLVWPWCIYAPDDEKMKRTIGSIQKELAHNKGFYRYKYDDYDCFEFKGTDARRGAGTWPIGNYWMAICAAMAGDKKKGRSLIDAVSARLDKNMLIPEQLFDNDIQVSVKPLAWSHAMQVIAENILQRKSARTSIRSAGACPSRMR
jgi:glucoamylase